MEIQLKKWGNSLGFRIPHKVAESLGLDEHSVVEVVEESGKLVITKKSPSPSLDELLATIPADFSYPSDVDDFVGGAALGQEVL
jgi:antitoxin MazE